MSRDIAIVIESLGGGGAQHVATTLANAWVSAGMSITMITFQSSDTDKFELDSRVRRIVTGGIRPSSNIFVGLVSNISRLVSLRAALRKSGADLIISFVGSTNILTILAALGLGRRVVISERNDPARQSLGRIWNFLRRTVYRHADLIVANSHAAIETMAAYVPRNRMTWLPNPLRKAPIERSPGNLPSAPFFLAVGRLTAQKAYDVLLAAFAAISVELPGWQLVILGDGPLRTELMAKARNLNIASLVQFDGYVDDPFPWYRGAKVFIQSALHEGMPNAVLEAMSEGLPVVVSDAQTGLREIVRDGVTGLVVPARNAVPLAQAMLALARDTDLRRRLGDQARAAVAPFHTDAALAAWQKALGQ